MGLPLYKYIADLPKPFPFGHQPEPKSWALYLAWESSNPDSELVVPEARGRGLQKNNPGIKPCNKETIKNDKFTTFGMAKLRCDASGHETIVHKFVVRDQSKWLRDRVDSSMSIDEVPVRIPSHISWWQVAWALEYMYEGRVPGFHLLAVERWPSGSAWVKMRSIAGGLLELWEAGDFFGLDGLKERAEGAFMTYFAERIRDEIQSHHEGQDPGLPERRVDFEFGQAVWRIFGSLRVIPKDYYGTHMQLWGESFHYRFELDEDEKAVQGWESAMFDRTGAPGIEDDMYPIKYLSDGPVPRYRETFRTQMMDLCLSFARTGLFELGWFQRLMGRPTCPVDFQIAISWMDEDPASPIWP